MLVGFCGSRSLPSVPQSGGLVARVVSSVVAAGRPVAVGCCVGADAAVLSARLQLPFPSSTSGHQLVVFSAGGPNRVGYWRGSAIEQVTAAAALTRSPGHGCMAPVAVRWWAGGAQDVDLRQRLRQRSMALAHEVGQAGGVLVAFVGPGKSSGTWGTVRAAFQAGAQVFVFPVGCSALSLPRVAGGQKWVGVSGCGIWSRALQLV